MTRVIIRKQILLMMMFISVIACESEENPASEMREDRQEMLDMNVNTVGDTGSDQRDQGLNDEELGILDASPQDQMTSEERPDTSALRGELLTGVISRGHSDGEGHEARFDGMVCATLSSDAQTLYISDAFSGTVRAVDLDTHIVRTITGVPYELAVFNGPISRARFESPRGCEALPEGGGLLLVDGPTLRLVDEVEESVETLAGRTGTPGDLDGEGTRARLGYLTHDITFSSTGEYALLSDRSNDRIRLFQRETMMISPLAPLIDQEDSSEVSLNGPGGIVMTEEGDLLIADTFSGRLLRVALDQVDLDRFSADSPDPQGVEVEVIAERLGDPQGVATYGDKAWVAGFDGEVIEVNLSDGATRTFRVDIGDDGETPLGGAFAPLVFDPTRGQLYYLDIEAESLRTISVTTGKVQTIAGPVRPYGDRGGALDEARFGILYDVVGVEGSWFVADPEYGKVKRVQPQGEDQGVSTLLSAMETARPFADEEPPEHIAGETPIALAYDPDREELYIADLSEHVIRRYNLESRELEVFVGVSGQAGFEDGVGDQARLREPFGLDFGSDGLLYVADSGNRAIRTVDPESGEVQTLAVGDVEPLDVLRSEDGAVYMVNGSTPVLFEVIDSSYVIVAGQEDQSGPGDGVNGLFSTPVSLTRHRAGGLLIADSENHRIRHFDPLTQEISTWLGHFTRHGGWGSRDPLPWSELRLQSPNAIALYEDQAVVLTDAALLLLTGDPRDLSDSP